MVNVHIREFAPGGAVITGRIDFCRLCRYAG